MPILLPVLSLIILGLIALSTVRIRLTRDPSLELPDDAESIRAYEAVSHWLLFSFIRSLEIKHLSKYQPRGVLLDAGCGPGHVDLALARKYPELKIIGVDISKEMIDLANNLKARTGPDLQVSYRLEDIQALTLEDSSVDFIFSSLSLHHWPNAAEALKECHRVLKPQGQLVFFDLRRDVPILLFWGINLFQKLVAPTGIKRTNGGVGSVWASYTPSEMESLMKAVPFPRCRVEKGWGWAFMWARKT
jgi:ubiquinone/menaquinone biosynthesis C-methylase UbiE